MVYTIVVPKENEDGTITYIRYYTDGGGTLSQTAQLTRRATPLPDGPIFDSAYNVIGGTKPQSDPENKHFDVLLTVDQYNRVNLDLLKDLGFTEVENKERIPFDQFIGKTMYLNPGPYNASSFNPDNAIKLTISGIVRVKEINSFILFNSGIAFTSELTDYIQENHAQFVDKVDYINIYPVNFKAKEEIKKFPRANRANPEKPGLSGIFSIGKPIPYSWWNINDPKQLNNVLKSFGELQHFYALPFVVPEKFDPDDPYLKVFGAAAKYLKPGKTLQSALHSYGRAPESLACDPNFQSAGCTSFLDPKTGDAWENFYDYVLRMQKLGQNPMIEILWDLTGKEGY